MKQKEYDQAVEFYEAVSVMTGCRCPKIAGASRINMDFCRDWAVKCRKWAQEQEDLEVYDQAKDRFNEGNDFVRNRDWKNAVYAFEEAAEIWDGIADTETENDRRAIENAEKARNAAELAWKYQQ